MNALNPAASNRTLRSSEHSSLVDDEYARRIARRTIRAAVVGLGTTGLPLALALARAGFPVTGFDTNRALVRSIVNRHALLVGASDADVQDVPALAVTDDPEQLSGNDVFIVAVGTPRTADRRPDLGQLDAAVADITPRLRATAVVALQSTIPPGTTRQIARNLANSTGLRLGTELHVGFVPERIDPGNNDGWTLRNTPRLVSGVTALCRARIGHIYEQVVDEVIEVASPEVAEIAKLTENTFRLVNIALAMELGDACRHLGVSARAVIEAAATKPFGFLPHYPSAGVGGECVPVDPHFLTAAVPRALRLIREADRIVEARPGAVVDRCRAILQERGHRLRGAHIVVAGVTYKPDVADIRNAPALTVIRGLRRRGAKVAFVDHLVDELSVDGRSVRRLADLHELADEADLVVLTTPHRRLLRQLPRSGGEPVLDCQLVLQPGPSVYPL